MKPHYLMLFVAVVALSMTACQGTTPDEEVVDDDGSTTANNSGGKGDTPTGPADELCEARRDDALLTGKNRFLVDALRWPAADVEGVNTVNNDDRGQEYTEYFAIVRMPDELGEGYGDAQIFGRSGAPLSVELNDDQAFFLEDNAAEDAGACIFTSWHSDVPGPLPCEATESCPDVFGVAPTQANFQMQIGFNSNLAASDLVQQCASRVPRLDYQLGDPEQSADPYHDDFFRGCMMVSEIFGTHWRSSDSSVCVASMRLAECGCTVAGDASIDLGFALVPPMECPSGAETEDGCSVATQTSQWGGVGFRGFPLGTWSGQQELPAGCEYIDVGLEANGANGQNFVRCPISGADLLQNAEDPKEFCRQRYAEDIVVHVPVPAGAIVCEPADSQYAASCTDTPWVVTSSAPSE